jgi:cobalt-zinc-cadmium efflux system protein
MSSSSPPCGNEGADRCEAHVSRQPAARPRHDHHHHGHSHGHAHDHVHDRATDRRRLLAALALSGIIFVAELVGGLVSGSLALISDAGHVFTDMSAQILSLLALLIAGRPATARRTFGYHRLEILAALVNGVLLVALALAVGVAAYRRLAAGVPAEIDTAVMLPIAAVGLVANLAGVWLLHGARTLNVRGAYLHVLSDTLASVAVVGGGIAIALDRRLTFVDPLLGLAIAAIVVYSAFRLIRDATDVLLEACPADIDLEKVRRDVEELPGIQGVHDLHIWTITSGLHALSAHIVVEDTARTDDLLRRVKELLVRDHRISHSTLQIESTAYDGTFH